MRIRRIERHNHKNCTFPTGKNTVIEVASKWTSLIVPHVLLYIRTLEGSIPVTNDTVKNECQVVCGATKIQVRPTERKPGKHSTSWAVHFQQKTANTNFRLFDESEPAIPFSRRRPIEQYQRCWGFHITYSCILSQRRARCGGHHETSECQAKVSKCSNCAGPHHSNEGSCMARPRQQNRIILLRNPSELHTIRERGHGDYYAALAYSEKKGKAVETVIAQDSTTSC